MKNIISIFILAFSLFAGFSVVSAQNRGASGSSKQETKAVVFGELKPYNHSSGLFRMKIPAGWTVSDKSDDEEIIFSVTDPTQNATLVLHVWNTGVLDEAGKTKLLKDFLNRTMSGFSEFSMGDPKTQKDGSIGIYFKFVQPISGTDFPMFGDSFVDQKGKTIALLFFIMPKDQYDNKTSEAYNFINSFVLN